jgi:hypothetical protein
MPSPTFIEDVGPSGELVTTRITDLSQFSTSFANFLVARGLITNRTTPFRVRLRGRLVVPRDLATRSGPVPICFIVMGNHNAFDGTTEIPNSDGYDYLQQSLADLGVASCSVDTNFANALNLDIRARAEILLETVELIRNSAPASVRSRLDFARMSFIGHSRGGEAVVLGALLFDARFPRRGGRPNPRGAVCSVASIAPTDFSSVFRSGTVDAGVRVPLALGGATRFLVLYGSHDGDVADVRRNGFSLYDRAVCPKTLVFARGLTHNRFNTVWNECADYADGRHVFVDDGTCRRRTGPFDSRIFAAAVHRNYAKFFIGALVRRTLLGDASAENALRGLDVPSGASLGQPAGLQGPAASIQWAVDGGTRVDEFDGSATRTPTGGVVESAGASRATVPHLTRAFVARAAGNRVRIDLPAGSRDLRSRRELTFRLTSMIPVTSEAAIERAPLPDWEMRVITPRGTSVARPSALDRRGIREPNRPFFHVVDGPLNVTKNQFDTLSIPLSAFENADWSDVRAVEFEARGGSLPMILDSIAFV